MESKGVERHQHSSNPRERNSHLHFVRALLSRDRDLWLTHDFDPCVESPLSPVWIGLEGNLIGLPLIVDKATVQLTRPAVARVCVENCKTKKASSRWIMREGKEASLNKIASLVIESTPFAPLAPYAIVTNDAPEVLTSANGNGKEACTEPTTK
ncbi:hypothetical protein DM860_001027 [Cuscuta australis]|uniref:DUF4283 domain-containing protein n=1 Tax=Cuscuta australis TaxID=267555 RepID=A0A328DSK2_9ASTE|nr:hypothetical protein DM860_001027 [Cuscuta australis]